MRCREEGLGAFRAHAHHLDQYLQPGFDEVEIFSDRWWAEDQDVFLNSIKKSYLEI